MNYEEDIQIDETVLDIEWLAQPELMLKYGRHAEKMRSEMDWAKEQLDVVKSDLDGRMRANPDDYDIQRISEGAISNAIIQQEEYRGAQKAYLTAKYEAGMAQAAVRAFDQRKQALENLVRLYGQQYFSSPNVPHDITEARESQQKRSNKKVGEAMKRRGR